MPSINTTQIINTAAAGIGFGFIILMIIVILWLINYYKSFNMAVEIIEETGTGKRLLKTRGRINHKKNEFQTISLKTYAYMFPLGEHFVSVGKGLKLFGYAINRSVVWLTVHPNPGFVPADMNMQTYLAQRLRRNWEATQNKANFWDKYGHQVIWAFTMIIFLIAIIFILQEVSKVIGVANTAVASRVQTI